MMSDPLNAETSSEISRAIRCDQICDQYEGAWRVAVEPVDRPSLEDHLALGSAQDQPFLLHELIRLDVHYRRSTADAPQAADYLQRFPLLAPKSLDEILCEVTRPAAPSRVGLNLVGRTFGDYALLSEIARGGMGVVYRARQISLNRIVALKMILSGPHASAADILRFRAEAEAAANLNHSGIVPIHEVGEHEGQHYFSMGYVAGQSLAARLVEAPLPPRDAAEIVRDVARAVQYAHEQRVIHRDLKPANILLDEANRPLVTDFGLARQLGRDSSLTNTGDMIGTPCFMSPEQASGGIEHVGPAADVYALGAVLYATLTGRPPFQAATAVATLQQVLNDEPVAPGRLNRAVPKDLETIALKCLAKSPARRYASAAALAEDLDRWLQGEAILARPTPVAERVIKWARRRPAIAGLSASLVAITLVALVLITGFWLASLEATSDARRLAARLAMDKATRLCEEGDINRGLLFFGYTLSLIPPHDKDLRDAVQANIAAWSQEAIPLYGLLPHPQAIVAQQFSPNSEYLLTVCEDHVVRIWSVRTGEWLGEISHTAAIRVAIFSPDSKCILTGSENGNARLWDVETQKQKGATWRHTGPVTAAIFYGDGRKAATGSNQGVHFWNVSDGSSGHGPNIKESVTALAISSDGETLAIAVAGSGVQLWSTAKSDWVTRELESVDGHIESLKFGGGDQLLLATADDKHGGVIYVWRLASGKLVQGLAGRWEMADADVDQVPQLVFTAGADFTAEMFDLSHETQQKLFRLKHDDAVGTVTFGPDDLLLTGSNSSVARVWDRKTGQPIGPALQHPSPLEKVAFSPDGMVFSTICRDTLVRLWTTPSRGQKPIGHPEAVMAVAVSSQGLIASGTSAGDVYIRPVQGGGKVRHISEAHADEIWALAFTSDGKTLITAGRDGKVSRRDTEHLERAKSAKNTNKIRSLSVSPDDQTFLTASGTIGKGFVQLRSVKTAAPIDPPMADGESVWAVAAAPVSSVAACAISSGESTIKLFHKRHPGEVPQEPGDFVNTPNLEVMHQSRVVALAFSPNGKLLVSGSTDQTARFWDAETGRAVGGELRHGSAVWSATFSADNRFLITGCGDGTIHVWDVATGAPVGPTRRHQAAVWSLACDPKGDSFWSAGEDCQLRRWPLPGGLPELANANLEVEVLTAMEFNEHQSARWLDAESWQSRRGELQQEQQGSTLVE